MPVTNFIWDELSDNVRMEVDENGAVSAEYMNEPSQFGSLLSQRRSGTNSFYHFDAQGSARQLTNDAETVTDSYTYTAFGEPVTSSGTTTNPFRFKGAVGYYTNVDTPDVYVRRRSYNPRIARWLSRDPLIFIDGFNLYRYVSNRPELSDPSGQFPTSPQKGAGMIIGKICSFHMFDHTPPTGGKPPRAGRLENDGWMYEAGLVADSDCVRENPVGSIDDVSDFTDAKDCCTIYLIGHRGGEVGNWGGVATYPNESDGIAVPILPNVVLEDRLAEIFRRNECCMCAINIVSCGKDDADQMKNRQLIADRTGCFVCGSATTIACGALEGKEDDGTKIPGTTIGDSPVKPQVIWKPICTAPSWYFDAVIAGVLLR